MKKILSIALCAMAVSAFADPTVAELGEVGVTKIETTLSNVIVSVSYDDLAGDTGMVYSNLVKTANLTVGDRLIEFRNDTYTGWVLAKDEQTDVMYWKGQAGVLKDSVGNEITLTSPEADRVRGRVGTGIWLIRQKPTDEKGDAIPFYIYGKPSTAMTITTIAGAWNLVGNPTQNDVEITNEIAPAGHNDEILVPAGNGLLASYVFKASASGGAWHGAAVTADGALGAAPTIKAGTGFWIKTAKAVEIKWKN